jgi:hypothetical protein
MAVYAFRYLVQCRKYQQEKEGLVVYFQEAFALGLGPAMVMYWMV